MSNFYKSRKSNGYSQEEAYFARVDRELIKKIREEAGDSAEQSEQVQSDNVIDAAHRFQSEAKESDKNNKKAA